MTTKYTNHLHQENSPYLLQHAGNPVNWYPWRDEALLKAKEENRLLIISIGYAACHWCHVMEHESFSDKEVADLMNRFFVSVKVDREERPDIDHLYMSSCQLMGSQGGWPLNIIALPDQRPVFAGTYFSKQNWLYILNYFSEIQQNQPAELYNQAEKISIKLREILLPPAISILPTEDKDLPGKIYEIWEEDLDFSQGGNYGAPKFPMPANLSALLAFGYLNHQESALKYVFTTLEKMAMGGIYDHLGGGFSRYSVDAQWKVPHFEKMLYDNAQLVSVYSQSYLQSGQVALKKIIEETLDFIDRELTHPEGIFYASLDADSQGNEGSFYTWSSDQIREILNPGQDPEPFLEYFSCKDEGNWEHGLNILRKSPDPSLLPGKYGKSENELSDYLRNCRAKLMKIRNSRIRPATDDKILTGWNGLMISGLTEAYRALNSEKILEKAMKAGSFYCNQVFDSGGKIYRNYKNGKFSGPAFLDDYAFLIKAFLDLYQLTLVDSWLEASGLLARKVVADFTVNDGIYFYLSSGQESRLILETIELSDNVIPSSNAQMAENLLCLGYLTDEPEYLARAGKMVSGMLPAIRKNPGFHARWFAILNLLACGPVEVSIIGKNQQAMLRDFRKMYLPQVIFSGSKVKMTLNSNENTNDPERTNIFVCRNKTCYPPVSDVEDALKWIFQQ